MQTPALKQLMGAYFHEDFNEVHGCAWQTVDAFLDTEPEEADALLEEIADVLSHVPDDAETERYLARLSCHFWPGPKQGGYRGWLAAVAAYVSSRTGTAT